MEEKELKKSEEQKNTPETNQETEQTPKEEKKETTVEAKAETEKENPGVDAGEKKSQVAPEDAEQKSDLEQVNDEPAPVEDKVEDKKDQEKQQEALAESTGQQQEEKPAEEKAPVEEKPEEEEEEFDWESYEKETFSDYDEEERKKLEELYTQSLSVIKEHEVIKARVVNITDKDVIVNIGFKSDGLIPRSEFKYMPDLKVGDEVDVMVQSIEGRDGQLQLSHKRARAEKAWLDIVKAHDTGEIVQGYIKDRTKGGMVVDLFGLDAFLPGSQLDIKPVQDYDAYVGKTMDLKVVKLNKAFRNIVVSHKAIIEQDIEQQRHKILSKLEKGQVLEGIVKNLTSFGVFVDLGGVDGLIHITDVSWGRINHPNELLEIGQKIKVVVLDYDEEKKRISLGMKQLTPHPWETLPEDIVEGSILKGKVVNIEDYGAFVEIYPGVEGLVHVSEMTWSQHLKAPSDYVHLGQEVQVKVLSIDREERKLSLGMKQLTPDPWEKVPTEYAVGTKHTAVVKNVTNYGLFVELEEGIDGMIHISDLSWTKKFNHPSEFAKVGDEVECVVLEIDRENRRLTLGHKQLEEDPWDTFESIFYVGSRHEGVVSKIEDKTAIITLPYNLEGYCSVKNLEKEDKTKAKIDEELEFEVVEFDRANHRIVVSHSKIWQEVKKAEAEEQKAKRKKQAESTRKAISQVRSRVKKATLGSELDTLKDLKEKLMQEQQEKGKEDKSGKSSDKK